MRSTNDASWFRRFARRMSHLVGTSQAFVAAMAVIVAWAVVGPVFHFSNTWQLVVNTGTTIVTFLMVFLIQNTQNRDGEALQLKLDELIRAAKGADNAMLDMEDLGDDELERIRKNYAELAERARAELTERGRSSAAA